MSKETKEKKDECCSTESCCKCCDPKTIAAFLRHVAEFFEKR